MTILKQISHPILADIMNPVFDDQYDSINVYEPVFTAEGVAYHDQLKSEVDDICDGDVKRPLDIALNSAFEGDDVVVETDKTKTANILYCGKGIPLKKLKLLLPPEYTGSNVKDAHSLDIDVIMLHNLDTKTSEEMASELFEQLKSKMGGAMTNGNGDEEFSDQSDDTQQTFLGALERVFLPSMFMVPTVCFAVIQFELYSPCMQKGISSSNKDKNLSVFNKFKKLNIKK